MADLKYQPVTHDHNAFLEKAKKREGFKKAYEDLEEEYTLAKKMLAARARVGLSQEAVAEKMGTTKSAVSRLEAVGKHAPSLTTLKKYAHAVGCHLEIKFVPEHAQRLLANTAALSPEDLNDSTSLVEEDPETFGKSVAGLNRELGLKILGGCCGTDNRHIRSLAAQLATGMNKNEKKGAD